jgi:hypothetical protein
MAAAANTTYIYKAEQCYDAKTFAVSQQYVHSQYIQAYISIWVMH